MVPLTLPISISPPLWVSLKRVFSPDTLLFSQPDRYKYWQHVAPLLLCLFNLPQRQLVNMNQGNFCRAHRWCNVWLHHPFCSFFRENLWGYVSYRPLCGFCRAHRWCRVLLHHPFVVSSERIYDGTFHPIIFVHVSFHHFSCKEFFFNNLEERIRE